MSRVVLLDNEAVQGLGDPNHAKHRRVVSHMQVVVQRKRRAEQIRVVVPTTVRVEAGWDRTAARWSFANRLRVHDDALDTSRANTAAAIREMTGVSVADAHLGAAIRAALAEQVTVLTSDPDDMRAVAGSTPVNIVAI